MTEAERVSLRRLYTNADLELDQRVAQGGLAFRRPSQRTAEVRRRTLEALPAMLPRFADAAEWLLETGEWRGKGDGGRRTRTHGAWGAIRSPRRGYVIPHYLRDPTIGYLAFALEFGQAAYVGALSLPGNVLNHETVLIVQRRGVGEHQDHPTDGKLARGRAEIVEPALTRHGQARAYLFDLDGQIAGRIAEWRSRGALGAPWLSMPQFLATWSLVAFLLDHGLVPDAGEELFRHDPQRPFEPGNIGRRERGANRRYQEAVGNIAT